jgi:hypothetical protein
LHPLGCVKQVYDPEALKIMGTAFENALQSLPPDLKDHESARKKLALLIIHHMDQNQPDVNLSRVALLDFLRWPARI